MAISFHLTLRNNRLDAITAFAGPGARLRLYTASYATALVECLCHATAFAPAASGGALVCNAVSDGIAVASGTAALARLYQADGTTLVMSGLTVTIVAGGGHVKLAQASTLLSAGQLVVIDSFTIVEANA
jgi:hypothetical protein